VAHAGRPADAADLYLDAAAGAGLTRRVELQRRAAEQMLVGGQIDQGLEVIRTVLREVGMRLPRGRRMVLASLLLRRAQLRWRGLSFVPRAEDEIAADDLLRIDTCWSFWTGLSLVDTIRAADFHTRHLLLALAAGEPYRIARGLAAEVGFCAFAGGRSARRTATLIDRVETVVRSIGHPQLIASALLWEGVAAYMVGQWRKASVLCDRALSILREQCVGVTWEITCAQNFLQGSLLYLGEIQEAARRTHGLLASARERRNLYMEAETATRMSIVWLAADDPDEAERLSSDVITRWSHEGFNRQHYNHVLARIQAELYRGRAPQAWRLVEENWDAVSRSLLMRIQWVRIEASYVRARCALLMAAAGARQYLPVARNEIQRIARERMAWSDPLAALLNAAVADLEGTPTTAAERLAAAVNGFDRADMRLYASAARRRRGALLGGEEGRELMGQADAWMASQGIKNPTCMTRLIAPGFNPRPAATS
jgi:eukaryotic-like serine/threonine-protein kinase